MPEAIFKDCPMYVLDHRVLLKTSGLSLEAGRTGFHHANSYVGDYHVPHDSY